ncbi:uncharacterized [Tachysurus ichikawai]
MTCSYYSYYIEHTASMSWRSSKKTVRTRSVSKHKSSTPPTSVQSQEVSLASWQDSHAVALACNCEAPATAPPGPEALSAQLSRAAQTPASLRQMERPASETKEEERGGRVAVHTDV